MRGRRERKRGKRKGKGKGKRGIWMMCMYRGMLVLAFDCGACGVCGRGEVEYSGVE